MLTINLSALYFSKIPKKNNLKVQVGSNDDVSAKCTLRTRHTY